MLAEGYVTMGTTNHISAGPAGYESRNSPTVDKQHNLLFFQKPLLHQKLQPPAQYGTVSGTQFFPHIHDFAGWQRLFLHPSVQTQQAVIPLHGMIITFQRRRGGAKHHTGARHPCLFQRCFPGVVFGHRPAFVTVFVFLINDNKPNTGKRGKQCGAGTNHNINIPVFCPFKLVAAFPGGQSGMQNADTVPKPLIKPAYGLKRKGDFRNEHNALAPLCAGMGDQFHIDLRLAAAGNPPQQVRMGPAGVIFC